MFSLSPKSSRRKSYHNPVPAIAESLENRTLLSAAPYLVPSAPNVEFTPILTTGDSVGDFTFAGTPDGLGAFDNGDGTFTLLVNHEFSLSEGVGVAHAHNASLTSDGDSGTDPAGSYIDRIVIRKSDLAVISGGDQMQQIFDGATFAAVTGNDLNFNRFCSGDLPAVTAFYNPATGNGTQARIYITGEETSGGRATASIVSGVNNGTTYTLPVFGGNPWENLLANPGTGDTTLVMGNADTGGGKIFAYVGMKQSTGNEIEQAGLTNGTTYEIKDNNDGTFSLVTSGGSGFARPEDGAWDPNHPNDYYFVTTDSFDGNAQLFRLRFNDASNPLDGGTIEVLVNADTAGAHMFDNITVDESGRVLIQEDPGGNPYLARVWAYDIASGAFLEVAQHNPDFFAPGGSDFLTSNEESSGVIDVSSILGEGTYLLDVQAHYGLPSPLVQGGQLLMMRVGATAGLGFDTFNDNAPALVVLGTQKSDHITVSQNGSEYTVQVGNQVLGTFTDPSLSAVIAVGYDGNDHIDLSDVQTDAVILGGNGNDHLTGGEGDDAIDGGAGNDHLDGGFGSNDLTGGLGNDRFLFNDVMDELLDFGLGKDSRKQKK